eukprot:TRINITY_DN10167_c0_g1_i2.p1 TRINITY_DN10167_c0_g1~~TRINITY_DN10167_c0_g1_i2.p1  ORF type:complete len:152 (+),score=35.96 TRINITY_DN10167_c0_g1_i2:60-458(+)
MAARRVMSSLRAMRTRSEAAIRQVNNTELQALKEKEKLPWNQLSKDEKITLYRAAYGQSRKELQAGDQDGMKVFLGVAGGVAASYLLFMFIQSFAEPSPRTINQEWKDAVKEKKIKEEGANPVYNWNKDRPV